MVYGCSKCGGRSASGRRSGGLQWSRLKRVSQKCDGKRSRLTFPPEFISERLRVEVCSERGRGRGNVAENCNAKVKSMQKKQEKDTYI